MGEQKAHQMEEKNNNHKLKKFKLVMGRPYHGASKNQNSDLLFRECDNLGTREKTLMNNKFSDTKNSQSKLRSGTTLQVR